LGYRSAGRRDWYQTPHEQPRAFPARARAAAGQVIAPDRDPRPATRTDRPVDASSRPPGYGQRSGRSRSRACAVFSGCLGSRGGEGSPLPAGPAPARTARLVARLPDRPTRPRCLAKPRRVSSRTARPSPPRLACQALPDFHGGQQTGKTAGTAPVADSRSIDAFRSRSKVTCPAWGRPQLPAPFRGCGQHAPLQSA